jgi:hypothetical protein
MIVRQRVGRTRIDEHWSKFLDAETQGPMDQAANPPASRPLKSPLDITVRLGWTSWSRTATRAGYDAVRDWLQNRLSAPELVEACLEPLKTVIEAEEPEERAVAAAELAELLDGTDDVLADTLWEGVLAFGRETEDADFLFEASTHLAAIAERHGDPLAAAEFFIDFLNWRRQDDHTSESEQIEIAYEEIVRLAEIDDNPRAAALYTYYQTRYHALAEADDDRAITGDWEASPEPYEGWE